MSDKHMVYKRIARKLVSVCGYFRGVFITGYGKNPRRALADALWYYAIVK